MIGCEEVRRIAALDAEFAFLEAPETALVQPVVDSGAFAGRLVGVKANIAVAGQAWTAGIAGRSPQVARNDALVVARLRQAGAAFLARLTMDEGALGAATESSGLRATQNPSAMGCSVGGSSGGSAAAVACGAVPIALGSDTLGSVRIPAAYCGVIGLKPGRDVLPVQGVFPLAKDFDTLGVLARTTDAIRMVLDLFAKREAARPLRVVTLLPSASVPCAPAVQQALASAQTRLDRHGCWHGERLLEVWKADELRKAAFGLVCAGARTTLAGQPVRSDSVARALAYGARLSDADLRRARGVCDLVGAALLELLAEGAILMTPTTPTPPFEQGDPPPASQADFTVLANISGVPAVSVPIHTGGPPVAVQLTGPAGSEGALLALADILLDDLS